MPRNGSFFRRTATSLPPRRTSPSTATEGCSCGSISSLARRHANSVLRRESHGLFVPRVRVAHDPHARVRRQDAVDPTLRILGAVTHNQRPAWVEYPIPTPP